MYLGEAMSGASTDPLATPMVAADLTGLPPAYVLVAEFDPLLDDGLIYAAKLMGFGVETGYYRAEGMIHGFARARITGADAAKAFNAMTDVPARQAPRLSAMAFTDILGQFTADVEAGDGHALAALFTEDGVYHDTFYGEFKGRDAIQDMLDNHFWRDAKAFRWDMREPLEGGGIGYSNWSFSYESRLEGAVGKRILFEGMSRFRLNDGMIERYDEVFDMGIALSQTAFAPDRISPHCRQSRR